jgi:ubiquinone biosynthesis protein
MERWMRDQIGIKGLAKRTRRNLISIADQLPDLPLIAHRILLAADLEARRQFSNRNGGNGQLRDAESGSDLSARALAGATLAICGTLVLVLGPGQLLQPEFALGLVGLAWLGSAWLLLTADR